MFTPLSWKNLFEIFTYSATVVACIAVVQSPEEFTSTPWVSIVCAWSSIASTWVAVMHLKPYGWSGPLIRMLIEITKDIVPFLAILLMVLVGFTIAFAVMLPTSPSFNIPAAFFTRCAGWYREVQQSARYQCSTRMRWVRFATADFAWRGSDTWLQL